MFTLFCITALFILFIVISKNFIKSLKEDHTVSQKFIVSSPKYLLPSKEDRIKEVGENYYKKEKSFYERAGYNHEIIDKRLKCIKEELINPYTKVIFHGGCLDCKAPEHHTIATCYTCKYYNWTGGGKYKGPIVDKSEIDFPSKNLLNKVNTTPIWILRSLIKENNNDK